MNRATGFASAFTNLRTGERCDDENALLAAILADATNLGLGRMDTARGGAGGPAPAPGTAGAARPRPVRGDRAGGRGVWGLGLDDLPALRELTRPKSVRRSDHGSTRAAPAATMERYAEIVAALKIRTTNKKGRYLSTARAIRLLEEDGVETPDGLVQAPVGLLKRATVDRVLRASGLDNARVTYPVAAVRFQAKRANEPRAAVP